MFPTAVAMIEKKPPFAMAQMTENTTIGPREFDTGYNTKRVMEVRQTKNSNVFGGPVGPLEGP